MRSVQPDEFVVRAIGPGRLRVSVGSDWVAANEVVSLLDDQPVSDGGRTALLSRMDQRRGGCWCELSRREIRGGFVVELERCEEASRAHQLEQKIRARQTSRKRKRIPVGLVLDLVEELTGERPKPEAVQKWGDVFGAEGLVTKAKRSGRR